MTHDSEFEKVGKNLRLRFMAPYNQESVHLNYERLEVAPIFVYKYEVTTLEPTEDTQRFDVVAPRKEYVSSCAL